MREFNEVLKQYQDVNKLIEKNKNELKYLENEKTRIAKMLHEARLSKDILTKTDIEEIFKKHSNYVWSNPYFNECADKDFCIQVSVGMDFKYFYLDKDNKIIYTYNADDNLSKSLIGKFIDVNSYEEKDIKGNYKIKVGIIKNGKFVLE